MVDYFKGLQNCNNQSCLALGVKANGQSYSCEFECKSGYEEEGVDHVKKSRMFQIFSSLNFQLVISLHYTPEVKLEEKISHLGPSQV